jgi:hypothetical protein
VNNELRRWGILRRNRNPKRLRVIISSAEGAYGGNNTPPGTLLAADICKLDI